MKTDFIPIDYDSFDFEGRNYLKITGRNGNGKRICVIDSCPVYFWAILKNNLKKSEIENLVKEIKKIKLDVKGRETRVEKVELHEKNFLDKPVKALKIFATNYKDLHDIANQLGMSEIEKRRGYDLGFITHYIIEKKISPLCWYEIEGDALGDESSEFSGIAKSLDVDFCIKLNSAKRMQEKKFSPKVLAYDIEADEFKIGEGEILMISLVGEDFKRVITWKTPLISEPQMHYVEQVKNEAELLQKFVYYVKKISPDFLVGYFSDGFDLPYIKARAEKCRLKLPLGLDESQPKFSRTGSVRRAGTGKISGIVHIDLLKFIQTAYAQYMQSETLSLNEVAKEFLGDEKKDFKIKHSSKLNHENWREYFEYNLHDSVLTYNLFQKFWPDILEFTKTIQGPVFDVTRAGLSKYVESYILHNLEKFNEIPEKRPMHNEITERRQEGKVEGAFVFEPVPGIYEDIAVFDFTSMHTSIIISHNISKGTLFEKKGEKSECYESPELILKGKKKKFYFSKKQGFFPELLREIFEMRKRFKTEYKKSPSPISKARSNAFKVLSASVHGYIAFFGARYYSKESSASILAFVRKFNKETIEKIKKQGYDVIYADTDSVAFLTKGRQKKEIKKLLEKLNSELPGIMELELEGFYNRGIWVTKRTGTIGAKKKYALIDENGKLKIRGFETVRRDWCHLARHVQNRVIKLILQEGHEKKALEYVKGIVKQIKNREIDRGDLIIRTQLKKSIGEYKSISPHVIAAKRMQKQEIPISQGNLIEYYIAETEESKKKLVREKVRLPEEEGKYNIEYYLKHQILPAVENIFQLFNIDVNEIIEGKKQTTLGEF